MSAAGGAPTARGVEGEILGIEFWKGFAGLDIGARGGEPTQDRAVGSEEEAGAFAELKGAFEGGGAVGKRGVGRRREVGDHHFNVVLFVAIEFLEGVDGRELAVGAHEFVALFADPRGDGLMMAFAAADQRRAEVEMFGAAGFGRVENAREQGFELAEGERFDGFVGVGVMLDAETRVEETEVLGDLGDGRDGGLAGAARDALFNRDGGWDAGEAVDGGARELFDELSRVGRHRFHEAALAFGEDDVEGEGGFAGAGDAGDDGELAVQNREREIFEIVLAGAFDAELRAKS